MPSRLHAGQNLLECRFFRLTIEGDVLPLSKSATWSSAPRWYLAARRHWVLPRNMRPWLLDHGSLTAKLIARSHGDFRVQVLRQVTARPLLSEQRALGLRSGERVLVREVLLFGEGEPWVFARSLVPLRSLSGRLRRLRYLRDRPLGAFLFAQSGLQRGAMEVSCIKPGQSYVPPEVRGQTPLWGRRSVFRLGDKPLLVSEVFLEPFMRNIKQTAEVRR